MDEWAAERVLTCVEQVPRGRVISYGQIGEIVGCGPRQVGAILREYGSGVKWWRVTSVYGDLPRGLSEEARAHWADEGITWKDNGRGCRIHDHGADLAAVAAAYEREIARRSPADRPD